MEEFLFGGGREVESVGKDEVEIEEGKRGNEKILLVDVSEVHCVYAASFQEQDTGQDHTEQKKEGERSKIVRHSRESSNRWSVISNQCAVSS